MKEINKTIKDVLECPYCKSNNCYAFDTDEIDMSFDNSHYIAPYHCVDCKKDFSINIHFTYNITDCWIDRKKVL